MNETVSQILGGAAENALRHGAPPQRLGADLVDEGHRRKRVQIREPDRSAGRRRGQGTGAALIAALCSGLIVPLGLGAAAQEPSAASEALRYSITPTSEGFVRLDAVTGTMTHCRSLDAVWQCEPPLYAEAAIDARLRKLDARIEGLGVQLATLAGRVPQVGPVAATEEPTVDLPIYQPSEPNFLERALDRLLTLVGGLKG